MTEQENPMSQILATSPHVLDDEPSTVEGRLADCLENAVIYVDEYQLSTSDRARLVRALRVVATMREAISAD
jgi:hypothetical protein